MRRQSTKGARLDRELARAREVLLARSGGECELRCSPYCTRVGTGSHHLLKRSQGGGHDLANLRWACDPCNTWVEDNPVEAHALGLVVKSWEATR
jgi:5-methylcytosine-specific restriction endonuclease McrA